VSVNGEQIVIDLQLQIQDTDQDWLTNAIPVSVTINDGVFPQIISTEPLKVEESDIDSGGANHQGSTPNQPEQTASGIVAVKEGSDAVINYLFDTKQFSSDNTHIKSQGEPVLLPLMRITILVHMLPYLLLSLMICQMEKILVFLSQKETAQRINKMYFLLLAKGLMAQKWLLSSILIKSMH